MFSRQDADPRRGADAVRIGLREARAFAAQAFEVRRAELRVLCRSLAPEWLARVLPAEVVDEE
jgi:hypothetical protein